MNGQLEIDLFPGTFITELWEAKLLDRRRACELRLFNAREKHTSFVEYRDKYTPHSNAWQQYDAMVRTQREKILRELDEINYVKGLSFAGPIVGGYVHLPGENGYQGPSIIDLFNRVADEKDQMAIETEDDSVVSQEFRLKAEGIRIGLEILTNPYKFLNDDERKGYDLASKVAEKASQEVLDRAEGHGGTAKTGPPKRGPGRPKGSKNAVREIDVKVPEKVVLLRVGNDGKANRVE